MARTLIARLPRLFRTVLESPTKKKKKKKNVATGIFVYGIFLGDFLFYFDVIRCGYSSKSPPGGDFNENTQHTFMLKL